MNHRKLSGRLRAVAFTVVSVLSGVALGTRFSGPISWFAMTLIVIILAFLAYLNYEHERRGGGLPEVDVRLSITTPQYVFSISEIETKYRAETELKVGKLKQSLSESHLSENNLRAKLSVFYRPENRSPEQFETQIKKWLGKWDKWFEEWTVWRASQTGLPGISFSVENKSDTAMQSVQVSLIFPVGTIISEIDLSPDEPIPPKAPFPFNRVTGIYEMSGMEAFELLMAEHSILKVERSDDHVRVQIELGDLRPRESKKIGPILGLIQAVDQFSELKWKVTSLSHRNLESGKFKCETRILD